jgi:hypothetical protein
MQGDYLSLSALSNISGVIGNPNWPPEVTDFIGCPETVPEPKDALKNKKAAGPKQQQNAP